MAANAGSEAAVKNQTTMDLEGDREIVIRRAFNGPARIVFDAWTRPEHLRRWWISSTSWSRRCDKTRYKQRRIVGVV